MHLLKIRRLVTRFLVILSCASLSSDTLHAPPSASPSTLQPLIILTVQSLSYFLLPTDDSECRVYVVKCQ